MNRKITIAFLMALIAISLFIPYTKADVGDNLALNMDVTSSSDFSETYSAAKATDGNMATRWASQSSANAWIYVDLGSSQYSNEINVHWEGAPINYSLQSSDNAVIWDDLATNITGVTSYLVNTDFAVTSARYWRVIATDDTVGYTSIFEFEVISCLAPTPTPTPLPQDMATSTIMASVLLVIFVIINIVFLGVVNSAMVRFLFALLTLMIGIASLTMQNVTFSPYLQMAAVVMSLLCMLLAAKARG